MYSLIKNILTIVVLLALAGAGYYLFVAERDDSASLSQTGQGEIETQEFLRRLNDLQKITLPTDIFSDARFRSLYYFGTEVEPAVAGREEPFSAP